MKKFFVLLVLLVFEAKALTIEFLGPCSQKPLLTSQVKSTTAKSVGELTIATLERFRAPHAGNTRGLNTAFNTPIGLDAMEVISDYEMRSYGWCYSVDNAIPEVFPDEFPISNKIQKITWFYGYAHYYKGEWLSQCEPAWEIRPAFLCIK
ncbi:hypothetical protein ACJVC5_02105 [Peredibacter sp. HCB2-198]|uniref:hypothetical protein n=1 Tax=Peredibacter sp. HCB2-198 TaxID=3383025 RepID=UPI0038B6686E